ncbi:MAG: GspE/PulE family protein [Bryobacteraceae bacterium]
MRLAGGSKDAEDELTANLQAVDADDVQRMAEQPTLINLVNLIILEAIKERASDIHVEPFEKALSVKYRVDGLLRQRNSPPKALQPAITSRIKIMAGMNIAERYVPQDGHITLRFEGRKVDIRVSTVPTIYGESVVMRLLDKEAIKLDLVALGFRTPDQVNIQRLIDLPHGMVLVTGPTGSGKTTTLYAALTKLYDPSLKIITIEDPVEYELPGVNQMPVNPKRGLTFATGLRSILRQDPDVIMVGEIRDRETADIAIRAALTGHLVFSTLHTNDAPSAITRLTDMGVENYLITSSVVAVLAQRLVRLICGNCRVDDGTRLAPDGRTVPAFRGSGCDVCAGSGYRGRMGIFEMMELNDELRSRIMANEDASRLTECARKYGMRSLREDGWEKVATGMTTADEVMRVTQEF